MKKLTKDEFYKIPRKEESYYSGCTITVYKNKDPKGFQKITDKLKEYEIHDPNVYVKYGIENDKKMITTINHLKDYNPDVNSEYYEINIYTEIVKETK